MAKKNRHNEVKVSIGTKIDYIERDAGLFPGTGGIAEVLREFNKIITRQQKQINRLESLVAVNDAGKTKSPVVFGRKISL